MSRREFSKKVRRDAFLRAKGNCEQCDLKLRSGEGHFDHIIPDALGGEPTLENCMLLCAPCHRRKTGTKDIPAIARTVRIKDREMGIRRAPKMQSAGFRKAAPQRSASRPIERRT